jgi:hypothetical protein
MQTQKVNIKFYTTMPYSTKFGGCAATAFLAVMTHILFEGSAGCLSACKARWPDLSRQFGGRWPDASHSIGKTSVRCRQG